MLANKTCETCRFWQVNGGSALITHGVDPNAGTCHLMPPQIIPVQMGASQIQMMNIKPQTKAEGWCGQWEERTSVIEG